MLRPVRERSCEVRRDSRPDRQISRPLLVLLVHRPCVCPVDRFQPCVDVDDDGAKPAATPVVSLAGIHRCEIERREARRCKNLPCNIPASNRQLGKDLIACARRVAPGLRRSQYLRHRGDGLFGQGRACSILDFERVFAITASEFRMTFPGTSRAMTGPQISERAEP